MDVIAVRGASSFALLTSGSRDALDGGRVRVFDQRLGTISAEAADEGRGGRRLAAQALLASGGRA